MCPACYHKARRGSPAVAGAACCVCSESDTGMLRAVELATATVACCYSHAHLAERLVPPPADEAELAERIRERGAARAQRMGERRRVERRVLA